MSEWFRNLVWGVGTSFSALLSTLQQLVRPQEQSQPPSSTASPDGDESPTPETPTPETERMRFGREKFFDGVRSRFGALNQGQVDGFNAILEEWEGDDDYHDLDSRLLAYILATAWHETGTRMLPVREGFGANDRQAYERVYAYLRKRGRIGTKSDYVSRHANGKSYYGRGYVQLTWAKNYREAGERLGLPLYDDPDMVMVPKIAARILVRGSMEGWFTDHELGDHIEDTGADYRNARRVINGLDKARKIAGYAKKFESILNESDTYDDE